MEEVSNLYPNLSAKNLTSPLQPVLLQSCNESINIEIQNAVDTVEKHPNPLHNVAGDTEPRGSQQNHRKTNLAKLRKTKLLTQKRRLLTRYAKTGTRNRGSQQNHRKINLAKLRKTKLLTQKRRLLTRYAKTGRARNRGSQQNHRKTNTSKVEKNKTTDTKEKAPNPLRKDGEGTEPRITTKSSQNQCSKVEKNKTTDTEAKAPKQPRKPKNVTRCIEASYAKLTKLEERKPKTPFGAKNECIIPQKVSTISLFTRLRFEITAFLKNLFFGCVCTSK